MKEFLETLATGFKKNANAELALGQKAYLRNQFEFYGLSAVKRRDIQKPFFQKAFLPEKSELEEIVKQLWEKPQREYQYFAQELAFGYVKKTGKHDIRLFEYMVIHKSWWDTVDFIANKLMGEYFKVYPEQTEKHVKKWLESDNIWLQRSALLFQLKYKEDLDRDLLRSIIIPLSKSEEFFIMKAIGWVLREYKTHPYWVIDFVNNTKLMALSKKEALRLTSAFPGGKYGI